MSRAKNTVLLTLLLVFTVAASEPPARQPQPGLAGAKRQELMAEQFPAVLEHPTHLAFVEKQRSGTVDAESLESYLAWLPLPPLELFALHQARNHDSTPVPSSVDERQTLWIALHEKAAREIYGDRYVDHRLAVPRPDKGDFTRSALTFNTNNTAVGTYQHLQPTEYQGEVSLAVNPNNPNQVVTAANTYQKCSGEKTQAIGSSPDGGKSWTYTCAPPSSAWGLGTCPAGAEILAADPAVAWNGTNEVFLNHLVVCRVSDNDVRTAVVTLRSQDGGVTWIPFGLVENGWPSQESHDKNMFAIDTTPTSPYYNRQYSCWHRGPRAVVAYSATGIGWSKKVFDVPANSFKGIFGCDLAVGKDGDVHLVLNSDDSNQPGRLVYLRSENGGVTWSNELWFAGIELPFKASADAQDHRGIYPFASIDVDRSNGACAGNLYVIYGDKAEGSASNTADVFLRVSENGGANWSAPVKVNDDGLANRVQFHPALAVDPSNGHVYVAWYDARNSSTNKAVEIYAARSSDCGASFEANVRVTFPSSDFRNFVTRASNENTLDNLGANPNQFGEYMGIGAAQGKAYVAWTDSREFYPSYTTRVEKENIAFSRVDFAAQCGNGIRESTEVCDGSAVGGKTCSSLGFPGGTLGCYNDCRAFYTGGCTGERFYSSEMYDGSVAVSGGGTVIVSDSWDGFGIRVGDSGSNGTRRGFLSFDTAEIPDGAVITSATLQLHRSAVVGTNPFSAGLGGLTLSLSHAFGGDIALDPEDYDAPALLTGLGCTLSQPAGDHDLALCKFGATALTKINKTGHTQIRLGFSTATNGNGEDDYMSFFDSAALGAIDRPLLVVEW